MKPYQIQPDQLAAWCQQWLGAEPTQVLFEAGNLSSVIGLQLADGRSVVVKARPSADRILACVQVQRHLWAAGFPCPQPLAGPVPLGHLTATAEAFVPGGGQLAPGPETPQRVAALLAQFIRLSPPVETLPTLLPSPAWVQWDHDQPGIWPLPDDRPANLNEHQEPGWLDELALRVRGRLEQGHFLPVVGHVDWEAQNLRWVDQRPHVVHDWDSVASRPEAVIVGAAAAVFTATGAHLTEATIEETQAFLTAYEQARGQPWSSEERQVCWAAGLWVRAFNAKKEAVSGTGAPLLERLASEATERLRRAAG